MLKELLISNRSYRGYDETVKVTEEALERLVDLTRYAASGANLQPLKYYPVCGKEQLCILHPLTRWAKALKDRKLPHDGKYPTAYLIVCVDTKICKNPQACGTDIGIAAQTILLGAVEAGLGGCMLGNFDREEVKKAFSFAEHLEPALILAIGRPDEKVVLTDADESGKTTYYRDENDVHYVPKRRLSELLIRVEEKS